VLCVVHTHSLSALSSQLSALRVSGSCCFLFPAVPPVPPVPPVLLLFFYHYVKPAIGIDIGTPERSVHGDILYVEQKREAETHKSNCVSGPTF
jgi:hypothetical protein